jgi:hypothetical protein
MLSHIVVKGSRSSKFVVCTGNVRAQHAEQLISGLKYKQAGSVLRRWRSPVRIRLAAPGYSEFQNCTKYCAMKNVEKGRSPEVDLGHPNPDCHASSDLSLWEFYFGSFETRNAPSPEDPKRRSPEVSKHVAADPSLRGFFLRGVFHVQRQK